MLRKAKVVITVNHYPVSPVSMDDLPASNIHYGEMTESHARRDRRRRRRDHSGRSFCRSSRTW